MPSLALITVLYKSDDVLEDFFKSIYIQSFKDYKLYLVDNSASFSSDQIIAECSKKYPLSEIKYINSGGNIGVAAGNNLGINQALNDGCSHLLLLNNDILIEQDHMFTAMMKCSEKENIITPKIYYFDTKKIWMAGGFMDYRRALGVHYGMNEVDAPKYNIARQITYAPTCFFLVKAEVFNKIGLMDEQYFAYYDDTDFVLRALKNNYTLWYEPTLYLFHKVSSSSGGDNSLFYIYYGNRNKIYFIRKNFKGINKLMTLAYTLVSRVFFYFKYNKQGKSKLIQAMIDGFKLKVD